MITRDQSYILMALHVRGDNIFSTLPPEKIIDIYNAKSTRNEPISQALALAADAEEAAVKRLLAMLDKDSSLLLQAGNVVNRGGNAIIGITPYELVLGEGDFELAAKIVPYFDRIADGEAERRRQYNRYKIHIDAMQTKEPYGLEPLFEILANSSAADVIAALNKNFDHDGELNRILKQFRADHAPRVIRKPCMHYNYKTLELAFKLFFDGWRNLKNHVNNDGKIHLIYRQIIGYLQLTLPGIGKIYFARDFNRQTNNRLVRTLDFRFGGGRFPNSHFKSDLPHGLGYDTFIFGGRLWADFEVASEMNMFSMFNSHNGKKSVASMFQIFYHNITSNLQCLYDTDLNLRLYHHGSRTNALRFPG